MYICIYVYVHMYIYIYSYDEQEDAGKGRARLYHGRNPPDFFCMSKVQILHSFLRNSCQAIRSLL